MIYGGNMPITELKEPYWEKQDGETPNQYCYFLEYLEFPTYNLREFHDHLCEENKKKQMGTKIVTYNTIRKWARDSCNKWQRRKEAKRQCEKEDLMETLAELEKKQQEKTFRAKQEIEEKLLDNIIMAIELEQPLSQINQGVQALKTLNEDKQLTQEKPTNYNKTDIEAETRVQHQGVNELVEAFYVSKAEWDKRQK